VRPISIAKEFVELVNANEYRKAELYCGFTGPSFFLDTVNDFGKCEDATELHLRPWSDIFRFQQRMSITILKLTPLNGTNDYLAMRGDLVAGPISIKPPDMYPAVFRR
jgi:hypothetical protein